MLPIERLQKIQVILEEREVVSIPELEKLLDASKATVYRDIKTLQKECNSSGEESPKPPMTGVLNCPIM